MKSPLESEQISNTDFGNYFFKGDRIWFGGRVALGVGVFFWWVDHLKECNFSISKGRQWSIMTHIKNILRYMGTCLNK